MKILLVAPKNGLLNQFNYPLGLAYLSAALKKAGFEVVCHNNALEPDNEKALARIIRRVKPDVLACGGLTPSFGHIRRVFELAREQAPQAVSVLGGAVLSSEPDVFEALGADYGVLGEGELSLVELLTALQSGSDPKDVAGLIFKRGGELITTASRELVDDLDSLELPDYSEFSLDKCYAKSGSVDIIASRGCPYHCTFCYSVLGRGRYRLRSLDSLFREIDVLTKDHGVKSIGIMDDLFTLKPQRVRDFCERIKAYGLSWYTQVRVDSIDAETLKLMKDSGCFCVFYGLESMDKGVLKSMRKNTTPEQIEATLELTHACGLRQFGNFIFGDPAETLQTMRVTVGWWLKHKKHFINLGKIDCWPGTEIYRQALKRGLITNKLEFIEQGCPLLNISGLAQNDFDYMLERVWSLHESMTYPARLEAARRSGKDYDLSLTCPHCAKLFELKRANRAPLNSDRDAARLDCPHCGLFYDLPVNLPAKGLSESQAQRFAQALELFLAGEDNASAEILRGLVLEPPRHPAAYYVLGLIRLRTNDLAKGRFALWRGLRHNPCEPRLHELMAALLREGGEIEIAYGHLEQAGLLRAARAAFFASRLSRRAMKRNPLWDESFLPLAQAWPDGPLWAKMLGSGMKLAS